VPYGSRGQLTRHALERRVARHSLGSASAQATLLEASDVVLEKANATLAMSPPRTTV